VGGDQSFLGWVVASYSLGQLLASPLFGIWGNKRGAKEPLIISTTINVIGNVMYCFSSSPSQNNDWFMLVARFIVGFGAGNVAVTRAFVSGATLLKERTGAMANMSAAQGECVCVMVCV
jgi:MFS transporter, ceroid-lipofuscinosis neuronal protein 7